MTTEKRKFTDQQPQRPDPGHGGSPNRFGIIAVFVELLGAGLILAIGIRFFTAPEQPDAVAWVAFAIVALLLADAARRLVRVSTGKVRR